MTLTPDDMADTDELVAQLQLFISQKETKPAVKAAAQLEACCKYLKAEGVVDWAEARIPFEICRKRFWPPTCPEGSIQARVEALQSAIEWAFEADPDARVHVIALSTLLTALALSQERPRAAFEELVGNLKLGFETFCPKDVS